MNKKTVIALFLGLITILGLIIIKATKESALVLYYGITCPHCEVVEEWLEGNPKTKEKSGLITKEVYENQKNSRELAEKAKECQIEESSGIGVPFLYDNGQCVVGDQPIINYLKKNYQ